jgi:hypothetical protein
VRSPLESEQVAPNAVHEHHFARQIVTDLLGTVDDPARECSCSRGDAPSSGTDAVAGRRPAPGVFFARGRPPGVTRRAVTRRRTSPGSAVSAAVRGVLLGAESLVRRAPCPLVERGLLRATQDRNG